MDQLKPMNLYVVDTGTKELYVWAGSEAEAGELVCATGEPVAYVEFYSDDPADEPNDG